MEEQDLCVVEQVSGTLKANVAGGRPGGAARGRGGEELHAEGEPQGAGGERWWAEEPGPEGQRRGIKARSRELRKKKQR